MLLDRAKIKAVNDVVVEDVDMPEWGGSVRVRGMSGTERDAFEAASLLPARGKHGTREVNLRNIRARLVACCAIDEQGDRLFGDDDLTWLGEKSGAALDRLADVAKRLSGLTSKDVDDLVKNSGSDQSDDSGTA